MVHDMHTRRRRSSIRTALKVSIWQHATTCLFLYKNTTWPTEIAEYSISRLEHTWTNPALFNTDWLMTAQTWLMPCHSQWNTSVTDHSSPSSSVRCCRLQYFKPIVHICFFLQVFFGCPLPLWPCGAHHNTCFIMLSSLPLRVYRSQFHLLLLGCTGSW